MIMDIIENAELYYGINKNIAVALEFLKQDDFDNIEAGRYDMGKSGMYYMVQRYNSRPLEEGFWEAHRKYIDIQYVCRGIEKIGYANTAMLKPSKEYEEEKDFQVFEGSGDFFNMREGSFIIFFPKDAHMPCLAVTDPQPVLKVVVKVPAE